MAPKPTPETDPEGEQTEPVAGETDMPRGGTTSMDTDFVTPRDPQPRS